jgi:hypothetical protein
MQTSYYILTSKRTGLQFLCIINKTIQVFYFDNNKLKKEKIVIELQTTLFKSFDFTEITAKDFNYLLKNEQTNYCINRKFKPC